MKTHRMLLALLTLPFCGFAAADEIGLPPGLDARACTVKSGGELWEKSLSVQFPQSRRALSTNDGMVDVRAVVNHSAHPDRWMGDRAGKNRDHGSGALLYLKKNREQTARRLGLTAADVAIMGTSADLDNMAVVTKAAEPFVVTALVTAGAKGNALRTGAEDSKYVEPDPALKKAPQGDAPKPGTVNILLLTNARLTDGALARTIVTVTEAKTAAFQDLRVPSTRRKELQATGTGTDSVIVVAGVSGPTVTYPGGHCLIGSLMGKAVHEAVMEALEKQNGFKPPDRK